MFSQLITAGKVKFASLASALGSADDLCLAVSAGREIGPQRQSGTSPGPTRSDFTLNMNRNERVHRLTAKEIERQKAIAALKENLNTGTTIYTVLRSVNPSGMSRTMDLYVVANGEILRLTWSIAKVLDWTYDRRKEALRVEGCGMDMGCHTVYTLSEVIFGDGYALKQRWL